ncbi:PASTA domain-containing protein [Lysinibacillus sp. MHQ-1]|nr:PASTA domain-containing protein [Lysinibacillus sp. MHQ-1]
MKQTQKKNSMRAKGSEIDLIVSLGVETTTVDNYVGQNYSQVEALIKGKYKEVRKEEVPSREPEGRIIEQSIPADTEVIAKEETMTFKVSQGVRMVRVESVVNYTKADMDNYVNRVGLNWRISREDYHETIPAGSVISQLTKSWYYGGGRLCYIGCYQ